MEAMTSSPAVSVIIPTYNRAHLLPRAIRSVLAQTFQDFEVIVVDDGSTDDTEAVVRSFPDPRIIYLRHDMNRGGSAARNTGIRAARGEYIAFLDSDDEWLREKLERQLEVFQTSELSDLGVVTCGVVRVQNGARSVRLPQARGRVFDVLLRRRAGVWLTSALMVKHTPDRPVNLFDESLQAGQDWDYLLRLVRRYQLDFARDVLVRTYRAHGGQQISEPANKLPARLRILEKFREELEARPETLSHHHFSLATLYYLLGDRRNLRDQLLQAVKARPWNAKLWCFLLFSLMGFGPFKWFYESWATLSRIKRF